MNTPVNVGRPSSHSEERSAIDRFAVGIAVVLHLVIGVFPISASGLLAPAWFIVIAAAGWLLGAVVLWVRRDRPRMLWLVPVVTLGLWWAGITAGEVLLGWTP